MALLAFRAVATLVHVVLLVATLALHRGALEGLIGVAVEADRRAVLAEQTESRRVMIERRVLPGALVVQSVQTAPSSPL